jgi:hypothetical protein
MNNNKSEPGRELKILSAKTGMRKLGFKGAQATEYALLCFFGALTPIIASPDMLAVGRRLYFEAAYELAQATEKSGSIEYENSDGTGSDGSPAGGDGEPGAQTCLGWIDLDAKYSEHSYAAQSTLQGDTIGMFQSQVFDSSTGILRVKQAESLGFADEKLLVLVEMEEDVDAFKDGVLVSVFTASGSNIIDRSRIEVPAHGAWIGSEHLIVSRGNIVLDIAGVPMAAGDLVYREGSDAEWSPSGLPCFVKAPWYGEDTSDEDTADESKGEDDWDTDDGQEDDDRETDPDDSDSDNDDSHGGEGDDDDRDEGDDADRDDDAEKGNNGHGNDADGNDDSNPGNSNDPDDHTDDDGRPGNGNGKDKPKNGNNGHGNDADGNDDSNPGNSNDPDDHTDDDEESGDKGKGKKKKK